MAPYFLFFFLPSNKMYILCVSASKYKQIFFTLR